MFEEFHDYMNATEKQAMFSQIGVIIFYISIYRDDLDRTAVLL